MYAVHETLTHVPANRDAVVALYQSLNQPHVAVPGKQAQAVQAFVVAVRTPAGAFGLFVYLYLSQTNEGIVYSNEENAQVSVEQFRDAEADALAFCESMGFMMDNMSFRNLQPAQKDELLRTLPVFLKDLSGLVATAKAGAKEGGEQSPRDRLARLLAAF